MNNWDEALKHMGLCKKVANDMLQPGLEFEDLVQEGLFGLIEAVETFDPANGCPWPNYACSRIRYTILDMLKRREVLELGHDLDEIEERQPHEEVVDLGRLDPLSRIQREVVVRRLGLDGKPAATREEVAAERGVGVTAIKKTEMYARKRMRAA